MVIVCTGIHQRRSAASDGEQESPRYRPAAADRSVCCVLILCVTRARSDPRLTSQWPARCPGTLGERIIVRGSDSSEAAGAAHAVQNCFRKLLWMCCRGCADAGVCACRTTRPRWRARPAPRAGRHRQGAVHARASAGAEPARAQNGPGLIQCCWCRLPPVRAPSFGTSRAAAERPRPQRRGGGATEGQVMALGPHVACALR